MAIENIKHRGFQDCRGRCGLYGSLHKGCVHGIHFQEGNKLDEITVGLDERLAQRSPTLIINDLIWFTEE